MIVTHNRVSNEIKLADSQDFDAVIYLTWDEAKSLAGLLTSLQKVPHDPYDTYTLANIGVGWKKEEAR